MSESRPRLLLLATLALALVLQLFELPYFLALFRPLWVPLVLAYWVLAVPQPTGLLTAWFTGFVLDVLQGSVLGQHALALVIVVFLVLQLRRYMALLSVWQEAAALLPVWALYAFLLFWIDGSTGHQGDPWLHWLPVLFTSAFWPLVVAALNFVRHAELEDPSRL